MAQTEVNIPIVSVTAPKVVSKTVTFGELDDNDINVLQSVLKKLSESKTQSFKGAKLTSDDLKVLFRLYKRTDLALPDITFAKFTAEWGSMSLMKRKMFFEDWLSGINKASLNTATHVIVISAAVVVFVAVVVVTLVTPMSPFKRVNALRAYC